MSKAPTVPDAWEDDWEAAADKSPTAPTESAPEQKKVSSKITKAQRRAQQAEFNRQLWAEAEGPRETNYFLETRSNLVILPRAEFKPPPILLSRKGPAKAPKPPTKTISLDSLTLTQHESSSDEDEAAQKLTTLAERQAQAAKDREQKQRKYESRRQEIFGSTTTTTTGVVAVAANHANSGGGGSGASSPGDNMTPPGSRSATPSRGGRGKGRRTTGPMSATAKDAQQKRDKEKELYDPTYSVKPAADAAAYISSRRVQAAPPGAKDGEVRPIRAPRGPDGSGRGGMGFAPRGGGGGGKSLSSSANTVLGTT